MIVILYLPVLFFSVIVHEVAHGYAALKLGDDTALYSGRLTLNPIPHIDIFGTIIVPLLSLTSGFMIGWAKPVPINPYNFVNPRQDFAKVGAAGPLSNIALAVISAMLLAIFKLLGLLSPLALVTILLKFAIVINILLAVFNLLPIPPLDGSRIVAAFLSAEMAYKYQSIEKYGVFPALIVAFFLLQTGILPWIVYSLTDILMKLTVGSL